MLFMALQWLVALAAMFQLSMELSQMDKLIVALKCFIQDEDGVTAIEYGLLAALIALALITGATHLGNNLNILFDNISARLAAAT